MDSVAAGAGTDWAAGAAPPRGFQTLSPLAHARSSAPHATIRTIKSKTTKNQNLRLGLSLLKVLFSANYYYDFSNCHRSEIKAEALPLKSVS